MAQQHQPMQMDFDGWNLDDVIFSAAIPCNSCTVTPNEMQVTIGKEGGGATLDVTTDKACLWRAVSTETWISITGDSEQTGPGAVQLTIDPGGDCIRTGTVLIGNSLIEVVQGQGNPCIEEDALPAGYSLWSDQTGSFCGNFTPDIKAYIRYINNGNVCPD